MLLSFRPNFCFCFQLFPFVLIVSSKIRIVRMQALFFSTEPKFLSQFASLLITLRQVERFSLVIKYASFSFFYQKWYNYKLLQNQLIEQIFISSNGLSQYLAFDRSFICIYRASGSSINRKPYSNNWGFDCESNLSINKYFRYFAS